MIRAILLKSYKHPLKRKAWPIGQIVQGTSQWISSLIHAGVAEKYDGDYPPKNKTKSDFFKPK
jgi:hypothetical protein